MPPPQISIIGAGISGLVLSRCLLSRGIACTVYERDTAKQASSRYNYGITLFPWAYQPLLNVLKLDAINFRKRVAVDGPVGGGGRIDRSSGEDIEPFRANRSKFEQLLREGVDVQWEHKLSGLHQESSGLALDFDNGQQVTSTVIVGADGPHSELRKSAVTSTDLKILRYVVYNGKRRLDKATFDSKFAGHAESAAIIEHKRSDVVLRISIDEVTDERVSISYTYSRPARDSDPMFKPDRPNAGARDIPAEFFTEVADLKDLESPFDEVFNVEAMKADRLLNWLMRSVPVYGAVLTNAAETGIVLIGDACHHTPILGSDGANEAIKDAMDLANHVADGAGHGLQSFVGSRVDGWAEMVKAGEARLAEMHQQSRPNL